MSEAIERSSDRVIEIKVRAYAGLRRHLPGLSIGESLTIRPHQDATIGEVLDQLGIPRSETKTCFVNGIRREFGYQLREGDELAAFPPIAGGAYPFPTGDARMLRGVRGPGGPCHRGR